MRSNECEECNTEMPGRRRISCQECNAALCLYCKIEHNTERCGLAEFLPAEMPAMGMTDLVLAASDRAEKHGYAGVVTWSDGQVVPMSLQQYSELEPTAAFGSTFEIVKGSA